MTRFISAILAFYLTMAIVQIPYVQAVMPEYVKNITTAEEEYDEEDYDEEIYYVSIVVPESGFDPEEEEYSKNLLPIDYDNVSGLLEKLPNVRHESLYFNIEGTEIPVYLYTDTDENQVTEIEFEIPVSQAKKVLDAVAEMANQIHGSRLFYYNGKTLYETKDKDTLVNSIFEKQANSSQE